MTNPFRIGDIVILKEPKGWLLNQRNEFPARVEYIGDHYVLIAPNFNRWHMDNLRKLSDT